MTTLTLRNTKGSPLTNTELDANFSNLNTTKAETASPTFTGTISAATITATGVITGSSFSGAGTSLTGTAASLSIGGNAATVTGVTSTQVTTALGFTPYNATNPSGYITSAFSGFMLRSSAGQANPNTNFVSSAYRFEPNANNPTNEYYAIVTYGNDSNVTGQLATHFTSGQTFTRAYNTTWSAWRTQLDSVNYNSYSPTLTGTGASGTWSIGISGNAATITSQANSATITASTAATANQIVLRDANGDDYRRYGYSSYLNMSHAVDTARTTDTVFYSSTDDFIRKTTATSFRTSLNVPTRTGTDASGTWSINVSGTAASETLATVTARGNIATNNLIVPAAEGNGFGFWGANDTYGIAMGVTAATYQYGPVIDYSIKTYMSNSVGRGFTWGVKGSKPIAGLEVTTGNMQIAGTFSAVSKSFLINHPTRAGMQLRYGSLEGPENGVYIRGRLNSNKIELPEYWTKLVDPDSITVSLTAIGNHQDLYVVNISNNIVTIANGNILNKTINCFYTVFAERCDVEKLVVES